MKKNFPRICDKFIRNKGVFLLPLLLMSFNSFGQVRPNPSTDNWQLSSGILGTMLLVVIVLVIAVIIVYMRLQEFIRSNRMKKETAEKRRLAEELIGLNKPEIDAILEKRKSAI